MTFYKLAAVLGLAFIMLGMPLPVAANFMGTINSYPQKARATPFAPGDYTFTAADGSSGPVHVTRKLGGRYFATGIKELAEFGFYNLSGNRFILFAHEKGSSRVLYLLVDRKQDGRLVAYDTSFAAAYLYNNIDEQGRPTAITEMFAKPSENEELFKRLLSSKRARAQILFEATPKK